MTEVWFLYEDGEIKLSFNTGRAKTANLRERPRCSLLIADPKSPYRYVEIRGNARIEADDGYEFADRVGAKYGGADLRAHDEPGQRRVVVTIEPRRVHTVDLTS